MAKKNTKPESKTEVVVPNTPSTKDEVKDTKEVKKEVKRVTKKDKDTKKDTKEPTTTLPTVVETATEVSTGETTETKKKKVLTKEGILLEFDQLMTLLDEEVTKTRENPKAKGVKFLRTLGKRLRVLKTSASRVMKTKRVKGGEAKTNTNSGLQKPVPISKEMAVFAGWNPVELKSRVEVTKKICDYVKENKLQDPEDKRKINADAKLTKLLSYDKEKDEHLTYYRIQVYMKKLFPKPAVVAPVV